MLSKGISAPIEPMLKNHGKEVEKGRQSYVAGKGAHGSNNAKKCLHSSFRCSEGSAYAAMRKFAPMESTRQLKIAKLLQKEMATILQQLAKDQFPGTFTQRLESA